MKEFQKECNYTLAQFQRFRKSLAVAVQDGRTFYRVGRGVYGLIEHKHLYGTEN